MNRKVPVRYWFKPRRAWQSRLTKRYLFVREDSEVLLYERPEAVQEFEGSALIIPSVFSTLDFRVLLKYLEDKGVKGYVLNTEGTIAGAPEAVELALDYCGPETVVLACETSAVALPHTTPYIHFNPFPLNTDTLPQPIHERLLSTA
jgi:hypothetical protein